MPLVWDFGVVKWIRCLVTHDDAKIYTSKAAPEMSLLFFADDRAICKEGKQGDVMVTMFEWKAHYTCPACNVACGGLSTYVDHLRSLRHRRVLAKSVLMLSVGADSWTNGNPCPRPRLPTTAPEAPSPGLATVATGPPTLQSGLCPSIPSQSQVPGSCSPETQHAVVPGMAELDIQGAGGPVNAALHTDAPGTPTLFVPPAQDAGVRGTPVPHGVAVEVAVGSVARQRTKLAQPPRLVSLAMADSVKPQRKRPGDAASGPRKRKKKGLERLEAAHAIMLPAPILPDAETLAHCAAPVPVPGPEADGSAVADRERQDPAHIPVSEPAGGSAVQGAASVPLVAPETLPEEANSAPGIVAIRDAQPLPVTAQSVSPPPDGLHLQAAPAVPEPDVQVAPSVPESATELAHRTAPDVPSPAGQIVASVPEPAAPEQHHAASGGAKPVGPVPATICESPTPLDLHPPAPVAEPVGVLPATVCESPTPGELHPAPLVAKPEGALPATISESATPLGLEKEPGVAEPVGQVPATPSASAAPVPLLTELSLAEPVGQVPVTLPKSAIPLPVQEAPVVADPVATVPATHSEPAAPGPSPIAPDDLEPGEVPADVLGSATPLPTHTAPGVPGTVAPDAQVDESAPGVEDIEIARQRLQEWMQGNVALGSWEKDRTPRQETPPLKSQKAAPAAAAPSAPVVRVPLNPGSLIPRGGRPQALRRSSNTSKTPVGADGGPGPSPVLPLGVDVCRTPDPNILASLGGPAVRDPSHARSTGRKTSSVRPGNTPEGASVPAPPAKVARVVRNTPTPRKRQQPEPASPEGLLAAGTPEGAETYGTAGPSPGGAKLHCPNGAAAGRQGMSTFGEENALRHPLLDFLFLWSMKWG
jgi:hypothetical protein